MNRGSNIKFALLLFTFLIGCTPSSENMVRKEEEAGESVGFLFLGEEMNSPSANEPRLDAATRTILNSYGPTIRKYSDKYGFDWRLILAVMKQESRFIPEAESPKGAQGLMQMMPSTGDHVARILEIEDMSHPRNNIRGGVFYLKKLYDLFDGADEGDRLRLALAAYNAGPARIYDAQELAAYLKENPGKWQAIKEALPLLSKRYYTLHRSVWAQERPRAGYFGGSQETLTYVDRIMGYYDEYRSVLN